MGSLAAALSSRASLETAEALARVSDLEAEAAALAARASAGAKFEVTPEPLLAWIGARLAPEDAERLGTLHAEDLALAHACAIQDRLALALFYQRHSALMTWIGRRIVGEHRIDDLLQAVSQRVFVGTATAPPRIQLYTGRGELGAWLRVVATREAINMVREAVPEQATELAKLAGSIAALDASPEIALIKNTHAAQFAQAFATALAELSARDRNLLRYSLLEGLSIDEIGELYGVHRATAARWLERARQTLSEQTKARLAERLALDTAALDSLLEFIRSAIDISLGGMLARSPEDAQE